MHEFTEISSNIQLIVMRLPFKFHLQEYKKLFYKIFISLTNLFNFMQGFGGSTIIVENPPPSDYLSNGHHQWPIGAIATEGYDPSMMSNDVRECVSVQVNDIPKI